MKFVVGIGNPGKKYDQTRHNVGFSVLDRLAKKLTGGSVLWKEDKKLHAEAVKSDEAWFLKLKTFVNHTGDAVHSLVRWHEAKSSEILFVSDDVNLDFGRLRFRAAGSSGGHHGLESVIAALGSDDFPRLRIGVGNERMPQDLAGFVLDPFESEECGQLEKILEKAVTVCETWVREDAEQAQIRLSQL